MAAVLKFVAWVLGQAWKYGWGVVKAVAAWAKVNWRTVLKWIEWGITYGTILGWIKDILGL